MKALVFFLLLSTKVFADPAVIKGTLISYDETHFKILEGSEEWKFPLGVFPKEKRQQMSKLIGKEVEVNIDFDDSSKGKK